MILNITLFFATFLVLPADVYAQALKPDFVSNHAIVCLDESCPESVGALIAVEEGGAAASLSCSITLISADRVLTNSHCIPKNLRFSGAKCGPQIELSFPKIGETFEEEDIACEQIESIGTTNIEKSGSSTQDWAIIKLRVAPRRNFADISRQALPMGMTISAYPVFYSPFVPMGQIYKVDCEVSELGYSDPQTFHPSSALFFAKDCEFHSHVGNSGTGIFNKKGQYVGLINSIVHQKNQSAAQAAEAGSPLIMGLKALCLPLSGLSSVLCELPEDDEVFARATVNYSTLVALEKSLKRSDIDPTVLQPSSSLVQWELATAKNVNSFFMTLYDYVDLEESQKYFTNKELPLISEELGEKAAAIVGYVPRCVNSTALIGDSGDFSMNYTVFNFRDVATYPGELGLYLNIDRTRELLVSSSSQKLEMTVSKNMDGTYTLIYAGDSGEFSLTNDEQNLISNICKKEQADKIASCKTGPCSFTEDDINTPSKQCQTAYKKWGFSVYLKNFSLTIPGC